MAELRYRPLDQADGSAEFSFNDYKVLAAVNGPLEASKRDELPEEAAIEVLIRPITGVAGIRERHFESIIHRTLQHIIRVREHPRTLIQVVLQIIEVPEKGSPSSRPPQAASCLELLPPLLHATILGLLSTSVPLNKTLASVVIAIGRQGTLIPSPSTSQLEQAVSIHVLAYTSHGELVVVESEGAFDIDTWEAVAETGKRMCCGDLPEIGKEAAGNMEQIDTGFEGRLRGLIGAEIMSR